MEWSQLAQSVEPGIVVSVFRRAYALTAQDYEWSCKMVMGEIGLDTPDIFPLCTSMLNRMVLLGHQSLTYTIRSYSVPCQARMIVDGAPRPERIPRRRAVQQATPETIGARVLGAVKAWIEGRVSLGRWTGITHMYACNEFPPGRFRVGIRGESGQCYYREPRTESWQPGYVRIVPRPSLKPIASIGLVGLVAGGSTLLP